MKALLLSVRPEHAINILKGEKTLELRKSVPKGYKGWVYVYVTKGKLYLWSYGRIKENSNWEWETIYQLTQPYHARFSDALNGTIPFRFWFDEYISYKYYADDNTYFVKRLQDLGYGAEGVLKRLCLTRDEFKEYGQGKDLYAWHIKNLGIFPKPMQLGEFYKTNLWATEEMIENIRPSWRKPYCVKKAPQSYMYVYVREEIGK